MKINQILESRDLCHVCGQTPCNCTHVTEGIFGNMFGGTAKTAPGQLKTYAVYDGFTIYYDPTKEMLVTAGTGPYKDKFRARGFPALDGVSRAIAYGENMTGGPKNPISMNQGVLPTEAHESTQPGVAEDLNEFASGGGGGDSGDYLRALASAWYNGTFDSGSLQKGIKSKEDVERLLQRGIVGPDGVTRKYAIDYNSDFDGVVISSDDYYEHSDYGDGGGEVDSRTGQPWGPYDYMEFKDEELDEGMAEAARWRDPKYKGQLYTQEPPDYNDTREYDRAMWNPKPQGYPGRKELPGGGEFPRTDPLVKGFGRYGVGEPVSKGPRKGLPSRDQISSLKQSIRDVHGKHTRANLPEQDMAEGLNEFAPDSNDGGEDDVLHRYARMWWAGDEATQMQIERALAKMGWEIGEDEGSYDNGGVFVVRAGDVNGRSYQSWPAEELTEGAPVTTTPGSAEPGGAVDNFKQQMANRTEVDFQKQQAEVAEGDRKPEPPEADYGADYQDMVSRVKKLAGLGPLKTVYDPQKRVYRNVPTAVQPKKEQR